VKVQLPSNETGQPFAFDGGGNADIYQGTWNDRPVALKAIRVFKRSNEAESSKLRKLLCREAVYWQLLKHPNIAPFLGVCENVIPNRIAMISPFMINGNLSAYVTNKEDFGVHDRIRLVCCFLNLLFLFSQIK
jgi:serine/threonine protein kinase